MSVDLDVSRGFGPDVSHFYHNVLNRLPQVYDSKDGEMSECDEGARLEIALTVCDGVLQISITVADPET